MENPASACPNNALAQPPTATGGCGDNTIPPEKPQNPNLSSPQIPPSPSMSTGDLAQITSPQLPQPQSQVLNPAAALDYSKRQAVQSQQQQKEQAQPQNLVPSSSMQANLQQSGSIPRLSQIQQQLGASAMTSGAVRHHAGVCGGQINFGGNQIQQQQQQLPASAAGRARSGMLTQAGPLPMPGQTAQHFNLPPQMLAQPREKSLTQGAQPSSSNSSGQAMQGMQTMGMIGTLGLNPQLRAYSQHRLMQGQIRQQLSQQMALKSAQKLPGQSLSRAPSAAALNTQVSGLTQNGQSVAQTTLSQQQQQWLKHLQPPMPSSVSTPYHIQQQQRQQQRQQQAFLPQQLASSQMQQKSIALTQQQISQLVQQPQPGSHKQQHLIPQQQLQQYQQLQQQQLQSSSLSECAMQKSLSLMGSQADTPASGTTILGSHGIDRKLLGKRKIHDLVVQVDPRGKLDPEVEDLLLEIADGFIDSVTTFACSLAKHRKSSTLETKDVLLHLEKNWNLAVPGYSREEKAHQKKSLPLDIHKNRMEMIRAERHQSEGDLTTSKITNNQIINNSRSDLPLKSSQSSELQPLPVIATESMHKLQRI